jgi:hypothetical protein
LGSELPQVGEKWGIRVQTRDSTQLPLPGHTSERVRVPHPGEHFCLSVFPVWKRRSGWGRGLPIPTARFSSAERKRAGD